MDNPFFDHPILNSPYDYPRRHWELDSQGQPTQQIIERRRRAEFITPIGVLTCDDWQCNNSGRTRKEVSGPETSKFHKQN